MIDVNDSPRCLACGHPPSAHTHNGPCPPAAAGETVREVKRYKLDVDGAHVAINGRVLLEDAVTASDYDALAARVEELGRERDSMLGLYNAGLDAQRKLWRECESLRKDAGRYRWVREPGQSVEMVAYMFGHELDAAIDSAMSAAGGEVKP